MNISWHQKQFHELSSHQLYDCLTLRQLVFVVEQEAAYLDNDNLDKHAIHFFAYDADVVVAYGRLIPEKLKFHEASLGRIVVHPNYRHQGLAHQLMKQIISYQQNHYANTSNRISAQTYLIPFYKSYGFEVISDLYFEDGLPHKEMLKN